MFAWFRRRRIHKLRGRVSRRDAELRRLRKDLLDKEAALDAATRSIEVRDLHLDECYAVIERNRARVQREHSDEERRVGIPAERKQVTRA